jgi:hypothetical protein
MVEFTASTAKAFPSPSQLVEHLISFDGPPDQFLQELLAVQCQVGSAEHGVILRAQGQTIQPIAVHPPLTPGEPAPLWLAAAAESCEKVLSTAQAQTLPLRAPDELYGMEPSRCLLMVPIHGRGNVRGIVAFVVANLGSARLNEVRGRLELTVGLLSLYEMRLTLQQRRADLQRMRQACSLVATLNEHNEFQAVAMALCNQLASTWNADRVSFGLLRGRYVKLQATSHTEKFTRKTEMIQAIEAAMEESLDQDVEVVYPTPPENSTVNRAASMLSSRHGPASIVSIPLRRNAKPMGALLIECPADKPLAFEDVQTLRLAADLITPRLEELFERDRWFGARIAHTVQRTAAITVGPTHTWAKLTAIGLCLAAVFLIFAKGTFRVEAPFVVQAVQRQVIAAPFEGYLLSASIQPGDPVVANQTVLAEIDSSPLKLELAESDAQRVAGIKQGQINRREGKIAEAQVAEADADRAQAHIELLQWRIDHATLKSPITGVVLSGDWRKQLGKKLSAGDAMFEVAPLESLRAELTVPEDRVVDLKANQTGQLAALSHPGQYLNFDVERIDPVAEVVDQRNIFRVLAKLRTRPDWLRPGMEGVAKVDVDRRSYAWIWTRELVNWVRMKLWI